MTRAILLVSISAWHFIPMVNAVGWVLAGLKGAKVQMALRGLGMWHAKIWPPIHFMLLRALIILGFISPSWWPSRPAGLRVTPRCRMTMVPRSATDSQIHRASYCRPKMNNSHCDSRPHNGQSPLGSQRYCTMVIFVWVVGLLHKV